MGRAVENHYYIWSDQYCTRLGPIPIKSFFDKYCDDPYAGSRDHWFRRYF